MDFWQIVLALAVIGMLVALWRFPRIRFWRRNRRDDCGTGPLEDRLRRAREVTEVFGPRRRTPVAAPSRHSRLCFQVPEIPEGVSDREIRELNSFAHDMVCAEEQAALTALVASEAVRGGQAIVDSRDRTLGHNETTEREHNSLHEMFSCEEESETAPESTPAA